MRETIAGVVDRLPQLADHAWIGARQENLETIHQHNVIATRVGLLGELRGEMRGDEVDAQHLGRAAWLVGR